MTAPFSDSPTPPPSTPPSSTPPPSLSPPAPPTATDVHATGAPQHQQRRRLPGPDVVRAIAMFGVCVMNYHGYLIIKGAPREGGWWYGFFDPWTGPLSTRFAATFVVTAGVGVTLLTRRGITQPERASGLSWLLVRRGLLLYGFGLVFDYIWPGTILPFYGAMFVVAALLWRRPSWLLAIVGATAALVGWLTHLWVVDTETTGGDATWITSPGQRSPAGLLIDVFFNGTHPLFPWLAFLCAGMIVGRLLISPEGMWSNYVWIVFAAGTSLWLFAAALGFAAESSEGQDPDYSITLSSHPFDRSIVYTASALGSALVAFVLINAIANRFASSPIVDGLARAGQMSLTIYLGHALVFNLIVDWFGWSPPPGLSTALLAALAYWLAATGAGIAFQRRFGRGPAEWLYRRLTASD